MLGNIGMPEILLILLVVLLLFGAKRIPEIAGSMGKGITEFKRNISDAQRAIGEPAPARAQPRGADDGTPDLATTDAASEPEPRRLV